MLKQFLLNQLQFDHFSNEGLVNFLIQKDHISDSKERRLICHIINFQHLWISNLMNVKSESSYWDDLPSQYWLRLNNENYLKLKVVIEEFELSTSNILNNKSGTPEQLTNADIIGNIFRHNTHHRAQILTELNDKYNDVPNFNFLRYS